MKEGRLVQNYFTREGLIYQEAKDGADDSNATDQKPSKLKKQ